MAVDQHAGRGQPRAWRERADLTPEAVNERT